MPDPAQNRLAKLKDVTSIIQSVVTVAAILSAGLWFYLRDAVYHRVDLSQTVEARPVGDDALWLHVRLSAKNTGESKVRISQTVVRIQKILPLDSDVAQNIAARSDKIFSTQHEALWHKLVEDAEVPQMVTLASGSTENLEFDFFLPKGPELVRVYSYVPDPNEKDSGWSVSTLVDLTRIGKN